MRGVGAAFSAFLFPLISFEILALWLTAPVNVGVANMKKQRWLGLTLVLMGAALLVFLPIILPVVGVLEALDQRRMRSAARNFACLSCGSCLGSEAIRLADEAWRQYFSDKRASNPRVYLRTAKLRIVRHLRAICPHCGARYEFIHRGRTFVGLGDDSW